MKKWEYLEVDHDPASLDKNGSEGWELVTIYQQRHYQSTTEYFTISSAVYKRELHT